LLDFLIGWWPFGYQPIHDVNNMKPLTTFVSGATGVLGKRVCVLPTPQGHRVIALRPSSENDTCINPNGSKRRKGVYLLVMPEIIQ
jgi:hypothetical protein